MQKLERSWRFRSRAKTPIDPRLGSWLLRPSGRGMALSLKEIPIETQAGDTSRSGAGRSRDRDGIRVWKCPCRGLRGGSRLLGMVSNVEQTGLIGVMVTAEPTITGAIGRLARQAFWNARSGPEKVAGRFRRGSETTRSSPLRVRGWSPQWTCRAPNESCAASACEMTLYSQTARQLLCLRVIDRIGLVHHV